MGRTHHLNRLEREKPIPARLPKPEIKEARGARLGLATPTRNVSRQSARSIPVPVQTPPKRPRGTDKPLVDYSSSPDVPRTSSFTTNTKTFSRSQAASKSLENGLTSQRTSPPKGDAKRSMSTTSKSLHDALRSRPLATNSGNEEHQPTIDVPGVFANRVARRSKRCEGESEAEYQARKQRHKEKKRLKEQKLEDKLIQSDLSSPGGVRRVQKLEYEVGPITTTQT